MAPRCFALIPSAGAGSRAGAGGPKQYRIVAGRTVVHHTLDAFRAVPRIAHTLVVTSPDDTFWNGAADEPAFSVVRCGGATRAASVAAGLAALRGRAKPGDWVLVHDAARCLITPQLIDALIDACLPDPVGGLLACRLPDTLKAERGGRVAATVDRSDKWLAQTPQMFRLGDLADALAAAGDAVTDEASAIEFTGRAPRLVPGHPQNFKLTYPEDFDLAEAILRSRA